MDTDVIVIGAGLAGLQCARRLQRSSRSVIVLESEQRIGGRVQTDLVDGYRCDKGFQLLNTAYPAVRDWINVPALDLQKFAVGVTVRTGPATTTLAHPIRHPRLALATMRSELTPASDVLALARWLAPTMLRPSTTSRAARDQTLGESFDEAGLTGRLRRDVLDTFLAGVLADSTGATSANYVRMLMRFFALGTPGLPREGMQALPSQMAASLRRPVRVGAAVRAVQSTTGGVEVTTDHGRITARAAVLAVGPQDVAKLTELSAPATRGVTTWWFRAPDRPPGGKFLIIDASQSGGGPTGPIWNTAVISDVAASYAPPGQSLVQATTLLDRPDGLAGEADVRRDLARIYRTSTRSWEVLAHHVVNHALPTQPPPLTDQRPIWTDDRVLVTGDHRATGSIQGALVSGDRAARIVMEALDA